MKTMRNLLQLCLLGMVLPAAVQAQFTFTTNADNTLTLKGYTGNSSVVMIPDLTNGYLVASIGSNAFAHATSLRSVLIPSSVSSIGDYAFFGCTSLTNVTIGNGVANIGRSAFSVISAGFNSVTIPASVTNIGNDAFYHNLYLTNVFFKGNAPNFGSSVFESFNTVYYLPGTTGWTVSFAGREPVLWNPQAQTSDAGFGVRTNKFGFNITGTANIPIVVEASTNYASSGWTSLKTCNLTNGLIYFSDPQWTNYPGRFYRLRSP